jgi:hypothetical protein
MADQLVNIKQAAIRDGMVLLVFTDEAGAEQTLYLTQQHLAPGDGIIYPREVKTMRPRASR